MSTNRSHCIVCRGDGSGMACVLAASLLTCMLSAGCTPGGAAPGPAREPTQEDIRKQALADTDPNVLRVIAYYQPPYRWMWTESKSRVRGLVIGALYLEGSKRRGVFGDGTIHAKLFVRDRQAADRDDQYRLVKEWHFTPEDMYPLRTKQPTIQGNGYMLPLSWEDTRLDLGGCEVRIVIGYERTDGINVTPSTKDLLVPGRGG